MGFQQNQREFDRISEFSVNSVSRYYIMLFPKLNSIELISPTPIKLFVAREPETSYIFSDIV